MKGIRPLRLLGHRYFFFTDRMGLFAIKGSRKNNFRILCADASCLAVLPECRNISICLHAGALPGRRLNT